MSTTESYKKVFVKAWEANLFEDAEKVVQDWADDGADQDALSEFASIYLNESIKKIKKSHDEKGRVSLINLLASCTAVQVSHLNQAYLSDLPESLFQSLLSYSSIDSIQKLVKEKRQEEYEGYSLKENYMTMMNAALERQALDDQTPLISHRPSSLRL